MLLDNPTRTLKHIEAFTLLTATCTLLSGSLHLTPDVQCTCLSVPKHIVKVKIGKVALCKEIKIQGGWAVVCRFISFSVLVSP